MMDMKEWRLNQSYTIQALDDDNNLRF